MINIYQPNLGADDLLAIEKVFNTNWLGKGPVHNYFKSQLADYLKVDQECLVLTTSCTEAIFAVLNLVAQLGCESIYAQDNSFIAIPSAAHENKLRLQLLDIKSETLNVDSKLIQNIKLPVNTALFLTHVGGYHGELKDITNYCKDNNIFLIEDAAGAFSGFVEGRALGTFGDFGVWSFDPMKSLVCGDGGLIYCKDPEHARVLQSYLYLGLPLKQRSGIDSSSASRWWEFQIERFGRRAAMNDINAAIGVTQLAKQNKFRERRKLIYDYYNNELSSFKVPQKVDEKTEEHAHYFYWLEIEKRDELATALKSKGIYTNYRYLSISSQEFLGFDQLEFPGSKHSAEYCLNIPIHASLSDNDVEYIVNCIKDFYA